MENIFKKAGYLLDDFRLFHLNEKQKKELDYHYHDFCKVFILLSGNGGYSVSGKRYVLEAGDVVLIGRNQIHRPEFISDYPYERIIIYINPDFLCRHVTPQGNLEQIFSQEEKTVLRLTKEHREQVFSQLRTLELELSGDGCGREMMSNAILVQMLITIWRKLQETELTWVRPVETKNQRIVDVLDYIEEHFTEEIQVEDLAEQFFISKYYLMRLFQQETGQTIHSYITDRRLLLAKELIGRGMSATDSSFQAGFCSYSSFTRAHKKRFGTTPTGQMHSSARLEATYE